MLLHTSHHLLQNIFYFTRSKRHRKNPGAAKGTEVSASMVKSRHLTGGYLLCSDNTAFVISLQFLFARHSSDKDLIKGS